ncbi:Hint domain-containing protein [Tropicimonas marinistellae]|uniref:Hint domain-containing protein n=1 Tax=Tropicimonas marinistellae TaxID=1739787 RepID=UPI00082CD6F9|nr:Hint domain-containing protein [Tropicimonas marinistellae]
MENAPREAFVEAHPVESASAMAGPLLLRTDDLCDGPDPIPNPGPWLISAIAAEARIMTPAGPCPAGRLVPGDSVQTLDHGPCRLLWCGRRTITAAQVAARREVGAISVPAHAFSGGSPRRALRLSPRAGVLMLPDGAPRNGVLVPARDLLGHAGIAPAQAATVTYVQLLLERHAIFAADGLLVESFHPGWLGEGPTDSRLRAEVLEVLPELEHGLDLYGREVRLRAERAR